MQSCPVEQNALQHFQALELSKPHSPQLITLQLNSRYLGHFGDGEEAISTCLYPEWCRDRSHERGSGSKPRRISSLIAVFCALRIDASSWRAVDSYHDMRKRIHGFLGSMCAFKLQTVKTLMSLNQSTTRQLNRQTLSSPARTTWV